MREIQGCCFCKISPVLKQDFQWHLIFYSHPWYCKQFLTHTSINKQDKNLLFLQVRLWWHYIVDMFEDCFLKLLDLWVFSLPRKILLFFSQHHWIPRLKEPNSEAKDGESLEAWRLKMNTETFSKFKYTFFQMIACGLGTCEIW